MAKNTQRNLTYQLRNNDLFYTPKLSYEHLKNIPYFSFPTEWNNLTDLRFQTNKKTFHIALTNALLDELSPLEPPPPPILLLYSINYVYIVLKQNYWIIVYSCFCFRFRHAKQKF